jgi:hypothetical protein
MSTFYWLIMGALALAAIVLVMWDNANGMHPGEELGSPFGDVPTLPPDQLHRLQRARFERMDGVL